jgi:chemotaxis protein methyltransferase CheR
MESAIVTRAAWARQQADADLERVEMSLLLEGIYQHYGYDFRGYALASLKRRLWRRAHAEGLTTLHDLSINVTSMFRDPTFYAAFRDQVVPHLRTYPFIRIWNAGCSTGEETFSLAILLMEAGVYDKTRIYATDINDRVIDMARRGRFPLERMRDYTANYLRAGGQEEFSRYYTVEGNEAHFSQDLCSRVVFANHNLVSDGPFNDFNVIVCRNVMIYFGKALQDRVHNLFYESLETFGVLALGHKESIRFTPHEQAFEQLSAQERLYRKIR